jgi:hypothetical protein
MGFICTALGYYDVWDMGSHKQKFCGVQGRFFKRAPDRWRHAFKGGLMKRIILLIVLVMYLPMAGETPDMPSYLPQPGELHGWEPSDKPQHMIGEDLFLLINGGAEIYHEYGFKQVVAQGFKNKSGKAFNLEIYEMQDPAAAYGMYTFKTGDSGKTLDVGDEGLVEDYYLNLRKGRFLVTVIGFDSEQETMAGIKAAARVTAAKLKIKGIGEKPGTPDLVRTLHMLPQEYKNQLKPNGITYLRGNLALFNHYQFDSANIFGLKEGVIGDYDDFKLFIFKYVGEEEGVKWFENARKSLRNNSRFKDFKRLQETFSMTDEKGKAIYIERYKHYIFIVIGKNPAEAKTIVGGVKR